MGRAGAFTAKVVMPRSKPTGYFDAAEIQKLAGAFDLLLTMVEVPLGLSAFINALAPNGRMHFVGVKFVPIIGE